jgi:hypothetical protein
MLKVKYPTTIRSKYGLPLIFFTSQMARASKVRNLYYPNENHHPHHKAQYIEVMGTN